MTVHAVLHRGTDDRPRDGKRCGCSACFGMCDFTVSGDVSGSIVNINPNESGIGSTTLYLLEEVDHAESEFGIDDDLIVPGNILNGGPYSSITLKTGEYEFHSVEQLILINGVEIMTYGYVVVESEIS